MIGLINKFRSLIILSLVCFSTAVFTNACSSKNLSARDGFQIDSVKITKPPFHGTIFIAPDIIIPSDSSLFTGISFQGKGMRRVFSRAKNRREDAEVYLFQANFSKGRSNIEVQVDTAGFAKNTAVKIAKKYCKILGQIPVVLRQDLKTVTIRRGVYPFGGGNTGLLVYTDYAKKYYVKQGILEETIVHETTHTSLDSHYSSSPQWHSAQKADPAFISTYAEQHPNREDMAESFLLYIAVRYRLDRISGGLADTIEAAIPHRIAFFDSLKLNTAPLTLK